MEQNKKNIKFVIYIFCLALVIRLIMFAPALISPHGVGLVQSGEDASGYQALGVELSEGKQFSAVYRTPGYPFFLSVFYKITGSTDPRIPVALQIVISAFIVFLVVDMGRRLFSPKAGFVAGLVYALSPLAALYSAKTMTESLGSSLYSIGIYFFMLSILNLQKGNREKWLYAVFGGSVVGYGILVAPVGMYLFPFVFSVLVFILWFKEKDRNMFRWASVIGIMGVITISAAAIVMPWMIRNEKVYGTRFLSTLSSGNLFMVYAGNAIEHAGRDVKDEWVLLLGRNNLLREEEPPARPVVDYGPDEELVKIREAVQDNPYNIAIVKKLSLEILKQYPWDFLAVSAKGTMYRFLGLPLEGLGYKLQFADVLGLGVEAGLDDGNWFTNSSKKLVAKTFVAGLYVFHAFYFFTFAALLVAGYVYLFTTFNRQHFFVLILVTISLYWLLVFGPVYDVRYRIFPLAFDSIIIGSVITYFLSLSKKKLPRTRKYLKIKL